MDKRILYGLGALVAGYVGIKMVKAESYSAEEGIYEVITQQQVDDEMICEGCPHTFKVGDSYVQDGDYPTCVTCAKDFKTCIDCEEFYNPEGEHKWAKTCSDCRGSGFIMTSYTSATYDDPAEADGDDCGACDGLGYVCEEGEGYGAESRNVRAWSVYVSDMEEGHDDDWGMIDLSKQQIVYLGWPTKESAIEAANNVSKDKKYKKYDVVYVVAEKDGDEEIVYRIENFRNGEISYSAEELKKDSCCCGATKSNPCACMYQGVMSCSAKAPMCACYKALEKNAEYDEEDMVHCNHCSDIVGNEKEVYGDETVDYEMANGELVCIPCHKIWMKEYENDLDPNYTPFYAETRKIPATKVVVIDGEEYKIQIDDLYGYGWDGSQLSYQQYKKIMSYDLNIHIQSKNGDGKGNWLIGEKRKGIEDWLKRKFNPKEIYFDDDGDYSEGARDDGMVEKTGNIHTIWFSLNDKVLKFFGFEIPSKKDCSKGHTWSNAYIRNDYGLDDDGMASVEYGQRCEVCAVERRGSIGGDVSWDMDAETFEMQPMDKKTMAQFRKRAKQMREMPQAEKDKMRKLVEVKDAEEGEPCPNCKCSHENLEMTDSYNEGGMFWIDMVCQDCGLKGGSYTDDVQWEDEGILQSSPQIAYNMGNPNFGALKCPRCFQRFEKAAESFSASGSGDLTYDGGRMVSIEEVTIVDYNWHTDPDETDDIDESDIESQVQEKVENEMYEGDSGNDSWSYGTDSDGTNVEVYYEWNKTVEDGGEEFIKGW